MIGQLCCSSPKCHEQMSKYCEMCGKYYCEECMKLHDHMTNVTGFDDGLVINCETGWEKYMRRHCVTAEDLQAKIKRDWKNSHRKRAKKSNKK